MQEVHAGPVDGRHELGKLVEPGLMPAPVVRGAPVLGQLLQVADGNAVGPTNARQLVGPSGTGQALTEVVEVSLGDVDAKRSDLGVASRHGLHACSRAGSRAPTDVTLCGLGGGAATASRGTTAVRRPGPVSPTSAGTDRWHHRARSAMERSHEPATA